MIALVTYSCPRRGCAHGAVALLASVAAAALLLGGCAVDEVRLVSYTSEAEVKPPEQPQAVVGSSPFPWDIVLGGASDILTGARKKAIEEKVGYRESRSFTLFRLKSAASSCDPPCKGAAEQDRRTSEKALE